MARATTVRFHASAAVARGLIGPASAILFVLAATGVRLWLGRLIPAVTIFGLYYPAIMGAALIGGELSAALALVLGLANCWVLLHGVRTDIFPPEALAVNLLLFVFTGAIIGAAGARLRRLLRRRGADIERLADREARYRALFEGVSEGFALMEGVRDSAGRLVDLATIEANPAIRKMFKVEGPVFGRLQSEIVPTPTQEYLPACERALRGERMRLEVRGPVTQRWFEVRLSRAGENRLAQIVVDITERKTAEDRKSEMFDELNHRVKNNLAAVSAMLGMQARVTDDPELKQELQKAIDRIQTIGDVHASLYRVSSREQVDFGDYLQRLCERLSATVVDSERVRLRVQAEHLMRPLDEAVALGLIINELVTNAAKHAYPPPATGEIRVRLSRAGDGFELSVSDDGQGLPTAMDSRGIGMRLVRSLVLQCRGKLEVRSAPGASFTVRIPGHESPAQPAHSGAP
jgi:two-component sensor histidine kinase/PAS domain-containing protein